MVFATSQSKVHLETYQRLPPYFLWTLDWSAVLGKPSKLAALSTGLLAILITLLRCITDKETEIRNTLGFVCTTHNLKKYENNYVNQDLKELYVQLKQAYHLLDEYIKDSDSD